ncbi:hypothetical protein [Paenibacillus agilis]|uniref:Uncharacterized protein n=1 Tax=Paenibacillus agilis TaxID=3020863 RepID=A0A559IED6_9BACL|nr:hypothetical protein [Paenibacillus agilis]TVX86021.1 hypothetical protein FPZ44_24045 [Paenibacillus agilis]
MADIILKQVSEDEGEEFASTPSKPKAMRVYHLNDGDIFTVKGHTFELEEKLFYEVKQCGYDKFMQTIWERTGSVFSISELNTYIQKT